MRAGMCINIRKSVRILVVMVGMFLIQSTLCGQLNGLQAQQYSGITGLLHTPNAQVNEDCTAVIGTYFLNKTITPDGFLYNKKKYNTFCHSINISFLSWVELAYTCTFVYRKKSFNETVGYIGKDRYFSIKINPIKEKQGCWWPAIAVGSNDPFTSSTSGNAHFANFFLAATKHFNLGKERIGVNAAYRYYRKESSKKWQGVVGGIDYTPSFAKDLRIVAEYDNAGVNIGADYLLWRHLMLQVILQDCKYISGGLAFKIKL